MDENWKDRGRLEAILAALAAGLRLANRRNREVRDKLAERDGIAEIRTADRSVARRFLISRGTVSSRSGSHPDPDYAIVYRDASVAVKVLLKGSQAAAMQAISEGKMSVEGDLVFGMWFNDLLQMTGGLFKDPRKLVGL